VQRKSTFQVRAIIGGPSWSQLQQEVAVRVAGMQHAIGVAATACVTHAFAVAGSAATVAQHDEAIWSSALPNRGIVPSV
jgi:hypothetical protein